jgi:hypothetical protein
MLLSGLAKIFEPKGNNNMDRRHFVASLAPLVALAPHVALATPPLSGLERLRSLCNKWGMEAYVDMSHCAMERTLAVVVRIEPFGTEAMCHLDEKQLVEGTEVHDVVDKLADSLADVLETANPLHK